MTPLIHRLTGVAPSVHPWDKTDDWDGLSAYAGGAVEDRRHQPQLFRMTS
jgi:L-rhamnose isomerase